LTGEVSGMSRRHRVFISLLKSPELSLREAFFFCGEAILCILIDSSGAEIAIEQMPASPRQMGSIRVILMPQQRRRSRVHAQALGAGRCEKSFLSSRVATCCMADMVGTALPE
jgi:hypothetical protein